MESRERQPESLSLREYNLLQIDVAQILAGRLGLTAERCLLRFSDKFRDIVQSNPAIAGRVKTDRAVVVAELAERLLAGSGQE